jgi:3-oxoacyl-(acyl-carrier-protein) synthase
MTVPDENRRKTHKTDDTSVAKPDEERRTKQHEGAGRSMREALDEADITPEDYEQK